MRLQRRSLALLTLAFLSACGGSGAPIETSVTVTTASPPAFESPHPDIWGTVSASEAGFDDSLLDSAFEYAMTDGFYRGGTADQRRQVSERAVSRYH